MPLFHQLLGQHGESACVGVQKDKVFLFPKKSPIPIAHYSPSTALYPPAAMRIFEQQMQAPTCQPLFIPNVDHDHHSKGVQTQYYVVNASLVPNIYTDVMAADNQIRGSTNYECKAFATKADALHCWEDFCRRNHGTPCPNAVRTFWGIKGIHAIYQSRAAALEVAGAMGLMSINLFGSHDKEDVAGFGGL
ncbi:hypothetical protein C8R47DRAFT_1082860 [Mycena vitilis]|nr:hypothetical protein C8R47DRAFT_1082860 [Mycena vitilis]